jgi:hypothetical protein
MARTSGLGKQNRTSRSNINQICPQKKLDALIAARAIFL